MTMMDNRPTGFGMWVAFPGMALNRAGSWVEMAAQFKEMGVTWLALNVPYGATYGALGDAKAAMDAAGIKTYAWYYSYPDKWLKEVSHAANLAKRCDGVIVNAEIEWAGKQGAAMAYVAKLLDEVSGFIGHAPLGWRSYQPTWPYTEFSALGQTHPQLYWTELLKGQYGDMVKGPSKEWLRIHKARTEVVAPIGVTYGNKDLQVKSQPPGQFRVDDLALFMDYCGNFETYSLYTYEVMRTDCWRYLIEREMERAKTAQYAAAPDPTEKGPTEQA